MCKDANGTKINSNMTVFVNNEFPKWREMEAQLVLSFAAELGVQENTEFDVYGQKYRYVTPSKAKGLADGYMNAIVYKVVPAEWQGYDTNGNAVTWKMEANLRQGIIDGLTTSGDIQHYRGGGYEQVATNHFTSTGGQEGQNEMDLYIETDQRKWHSETVDNKLNLGVFDFEGKYEKVGHLTNVVRGWLKQRVPHTSFYKMMGGQRNTYVSGFNANENYYSSTDNQRVRLCVRLGGYAYWAFAGSRSLSAGLSVRATFRSYGGSAQCLFTKRS